EAAAGAETAALGECARRLGIRRRVRLRLLGPDAVPMTWGVFRPVIMLPAGSMTWPGGRLRAVLLHELAHVARLDVLAHAAARLACAVFWFHPGIWYAARAMRREAESACDDRVLLAGVRPVDYAAELLQLVRAMRPAPAAAAAALPMTQGGGLERRIRAVLDEARPRRLPRPAVPALVAVAAVFEPMTQGGGLERRIRAVLDEARPRRLPRPAVPALVAVAAVFVGGLAGLGRADGASGAVERAWALPAALEGPYAGWLLACGDAPGAAAVVC